MHPCLSEMSEVDATDRASRLTDVTVDSLVQSIIVADGVKARFCRLGRGGTGDSIAGPVWRRK